MSLFLRFPIVLWLATTGLLLAQPDSGAPAEVSLQFRVLAWQTELPALRSASAIIAEPLEASSVSAAFAYTGPALLRFYSGAAPAETFQSKPPRALASVTLPQDASRVTLLTTSAGSGRYRMQALPEDGDLMPLGFLRLHNFTTLTLLVTYDGDRGVQIPPSDTAYIRPAGNATVIRVSRQEKGRWRKLFNNVVELNPDQRGNIILAAEPARPVTMYSLPPWPKTPSPPPTTPPLPEPST